MFAVKEISATGIHFAGSSLRVVALTRTGEGTVLRGMVQEGLERPFAPAELAAPELRQELAAQLQSISSGGDIDFSHSCIGLDPRAVLLKRRPLSSPTGRRSGRRQKGDREQLLWEAQQFLGEEHEEFSIDFALTDRYGFVVAVRRRVLDLYLEVCAAAGIEATDVDIEPFALYNAAEQAGLLEGPGAELLLEVAADGAAVQALLLIGGELVAATRCVREPEEESSLAEMLVNWVRQMDESGEGALRQVCMAGEACESLGRELEEQLGVECEAFDPFAMVDTSKNAHPGLLQAAPAFAVAAGLAQRRLVE